MKKIEKKVVRVEKHIHSFYCDKCGKLIEESEEYEYGYYEIPEQCEMKIDFGKDQMYFSKTYCKTCEYEVLNEMKKHFIKMGFE